MSLLLMLALSACQPECPPPATAPAPSSGQALEEWEVKVLEPVLAELRQGVRPLGDQGFGLCSGKVECESFLGPNPGELAPGEYFLKAELAIPRVGTGWKADFHIECTLTGKDGIPPQVHDRSYDLKYMGADRAQRLQPLWRVQSPHPNGARTCTWSLTPVRPDGAKGTPWTGAYSTPAGDP